MSTIKIRTFEPIDYDMVCAWWIAHSAPPIPFELLPAFGMVAHRHEKDLMAGWVYFDTTTPVCFASHLVASPGLPLSVATNASTAIFVEARHHAYLAGYRVMLMYAPKGIARIAERKLGFSIDKGSLSNLAAFLDERSVLCQ